MNQNNKPQARLLGTAVLVLAAFAPTQSPAGTATPPSPAQLNEYCKGVAVAQISMITTWLKYPDGALSLESWKNYALADATGVAGISKVARFGVASHINGFTHEHRRQMSARLRVGLSDSGLSREQFLRVLEPTIPDLMKEKFLSCRDEVASIPLAGQKQ
jgi:hypothetical protein